MNEKIQTRKDSSASTRFFELEPLESFTGLNLPSNRDILRRFFHIRDQSKCNTKSRDIATQIYKELEGLYGKVPVLMKAIWN